MSCNLTGAYANADWGVYNEIGDDAPDTWRTLTKDEWVYQFHGRTNAEKLFGLGTVNDVKGTIILPDGYADWITKEGYIQTPGGIIFYPSTTKGLVWQYGREYFNNKSDNFSHNTYTSKQWLKMEILGSVFFFCHKLITEVVFIGLPRTTHPPMTVLIVHTI